MARTQAVRRQTIKGAKKLTDDKIVSQVMCKDPVTLTEAERASQEMFQDPDTIRGITKFQAAPEKMTDEEKTEELDGMRKQLGMLMRKRGKPESPYEADTTEER